MSAKVGCAGSGFKVVEPHAIDLCAQMVNVRAGINGAMRGDEDLTVGKHGARGGLSSRVPGLVDLSPPDQTGGYESPVYFQRFRDGSVVVSASELVGLAYHPSASSVGDLGKFDGLPTAAATEREFPLPRCLSGSRAVASEIVVGLALLPSVLLMRVRSDVRLFTTAALAKARWVRHRISSVMVGLEFSADRRVIQCQ